MADGSFQASRPTPSPGTRPVGETAGEGRARAPQPLKEDRAHFHSFGDLANGIVGKMKVVG